jgi:hypothetical protein
MAKRERVNEIDHLRTTEHNVEGPIMKETAKVKQRNLVSWKWGKVVLFLAVLSSTTFFLSHNSLHIQEIKFKKGGCGPAERRALARLGDAASEEQWRTMTECILRTGFETKLGYFHMHVSKSAGTALCGSMRDACAQEKKADCLLQPLKMRPYWYRNNKQTSEMGSQPWGRLLPWFRDVTCRELEKKMGWANWKVVMSERNIPFAKIQSGKLQPLCTKFVNSINFRDPVGRIESHYQHLFRNCQETMRRNKEPESNCNQLFYTTEEGDKFNVPKLVKIYDILSDNYYTRSLNPEWVYKWQASSSIPTLSQHPKAMSEILPFANASLHAFDWVFLVKSGPEQEEAEKNDLVFRYGMGFPNSTLRYFGHSGKVTPFEETGKTLSDVSLLRRIQSLDYLLFEEAKRLHRLDVIASERMKPHIEALMARIQGNQRCCGSTCLENDYFNTTPPMFHNVQDILGVY